LRGLLIIREGVFKSLDQTVDDKPDCPGHQSYANKGDKIGPKHKHITPSLPSLEKLLRLFNFAIHFKLSRFRGQSHISLFGYQASNCNLKGFVLQNSMAKGLNGDSGQLGSQPFETQRPAFTVNPLEGSQIHALEGVQAASREVVKKEPTRAARHCGSGPPGEMTSKGFRDVMEII
jgi:hypothetical protein